MIKNIVVAYGAGRGDKVALRQALDLARPAQARLHLVTIESLGNAPAEAGLVSETAPEAFAVSAASTLVTVEEAPEHGVSAELEQGASVCADEHIPCTLGQYYGDASSRLYELSRIADLLVLSRHPEGRGSGSGGLGRTAARLITKSYRPTLYCDRESLTLGSAILAYEPRPAGGRALSVAGEVCSLLNISLHVTASGLGDVTVAQSLNEARRAIRSYHVESDFVPASGTAAEALPGLAMAAGSQLIIVPGAPRQGFFVDDRLVRTALDLPNTVVLMVP